MMKTCALCRKSFPLDNFYLSAKGEYYSYCKPCTLKHRAVYRAKNTEKIALSDHKYANSEKGFIIQTINSIFQRYKRKSKKKKWKPECTKQEIYDELELYMQEHDRICEYCAQPWTYSRPVIGTRGEGPKKRGPQIFTNFSIDRLDSTKTYEVRKPAHNISNLVFCCIGCNNRKNQVTLSDIDNIKRVWGERNEVE
jgi:5-methylcytosine-specific restriction endonuclease McrA